MSKFSAEVHYPLPEPGEINPVEYFYGHLLGAEVVDDTEEIGFKYVTFGDACLHFYGRPADSSHSYFGEFYEDEPGGNGVELSIVLAEDFPLKKYFRAVTWTLPARNIIRPIRSHAGGEEFRVADPFGYLLRFTQGISLECEAHRPDNLPEHETWDPFTAMKDSHKELFWLPKSKS